jgi:hypothetical protein
VYQALDVAAPNTVIRVADGTYLPDTTGLGDSRWATFQLANGVTLEGGFAGCGATDEDERNVELYETILSGDLDGNDEPAFTYRSDNSYHVVSATGTDSTAILDGFTITAGYADRDDDLWRTNTGAAVNCTSSAGQATFANCIFRDNWAATVGGAVCSFGSSQLKFINCAFSGNHATTQGGAVFGSSAGNSLTMTNCTVVDNYAGGSGGGVFWSSGTSAWITNCTFIGNQSGGSGSSVGGLHVGSNITSAWITNCTFVGNESGAGSVGGLQAGSNTTHVNNCIFWENSSAQLDPPTLIHVNHNAIQGGGWAAVNGNITLDASNPPLFEDADGADGIAGTEDDNLRLTAGSPCVDVGNQNLLPADLADLDGDGDVVEAIPFDLDGNTRVVGDDVDLGAYEFADGSGNEPPTAVAGDPIAIHAGDTVFLNGIASYDDNDASEDLVYAWTLTEIPAGSTAVLADADTAEPSFIADLPGTYEASLVVTDTQGLSSGPGSVTVSSQNLAPIAVAGEDSGAVVGDLVVLDGRGSSDPDLDLFTYCWSITQAPAGSTATLDDPTIEMPSLTPDLPGAYRVRLVVNDGFADSEPDEVIICVISAEDFAEIQTMGALNIVSELPASSVTTKGNQKALGNFLTQVIGALQLGDTEEAINKLDKALSRTDGCALQGAPDGNGTGRDWITNCVDQESVYDLLWEALDALTE